MQLSEKSSAKLVLFFELCKIIRFSSLFICVYHFFCVILHRKMNRAAVAKKVLQYLAHAEGICLSGGGKYRTY